LLDGRKDPVDAPLVFERVLGVLKARNWLMSVPDAKALPPAPVMMSARTEVSVSSSVQISPSRSYMANVRALRACGRLNVTFAIPSSSSKRRSWSGMAEGLLTSWSRERSVLAEPVRPWIAGRVGAGAYFASAAPPRQSWTGGVTIVGSVLDGSPARMIGIVTPVLIRDGWRDREAPRAA
jgi:hypothetical protein